MNIPPHAKKVFSGRMFEVYQWPQQVFDGSEQTYEVIKRPDSVQIIAVQGESLVIADEEQPGRAPFLSLFGGVKENGEEPLEAAKRELLEESGLVSEDWEVYRVFESPGRVAWNVTIFLARDCRDGGGQQLDAGEKITPKIVSPEEFFTLLRDPNFRGREMLFDLALEQTDQAGKERIHNWLFKTRGE